MLKENPSLRQPRCLLYAIAAGIGGPGLNTVAEESLVLAWERGFLGRAVALANRQNRIPASSILELKWHPARALSFLPRPYA
ncbi:MAG: hypothetical protein N2322_04755, partial [Terrimicrobiaceae bacterium]|nr:hypothetical protein [Terrimicrobiaceae bacterium]